MWHYWKSAEYQRERYKERHDKVEKCNVCGEEMTHYKLLSHKISKHRGRYWCEVCRVGVLNIWDHERTTSARAIERGVWRSRGWRCEGSERSRGSIV